MRWRTGLPATTLVLLVGCTGGSGSSPTSSSSTGTSTGAPTVTQTRTQTETATATATTTDTLPAGFGLQKATSKTWPDPSGTLDHGVAVRVGQHGAYDRVVYEFAGSGTPSFQVRYVDTPIGDPSGEPVDVKGQAALEVFVSGLGYPGTGDEPTPPADAELAGTVIAETGLLFGGFENRAQTFIGVRGERRPFRVITLAGPPRLVVDIAH